MNNTVLSSRPRLPAVMPLGYCDECNRLIRKEVIYCPHCAESACSMKCLVHHLCRHVENGPLDTIADQPLAATVETVIDID